MKKSHVTKAVKNPTVSSELIQSLVKKDIESLASGGFAETCSNGFIKAS